MPDTLGDYIGCGIIMAGLAPLAVAEHRSRSSDARSVRSLVAASIVCFATGAAIVILM